MWSISHAQTRSLFGTITVACENLPKERKSMLTMVSTYAWTKKWQLTEHNTLNIMGLLAILPLPETECGSLNGWTFLCF